MSLVVTGTVKLWPFPGVSVVIVNMWTVVSVTVKLWTFAVISVTVKQDICRCVSNCQTVDIYSSVRNCQLDSRTCARLHCCWNSLMLFLVRGSCSRSRRP